MSNLLTNKGNFFEIFKEEGISIVFSSLPGFISSSLGVFFNIGSRDEPIQYRGIAHFLEHMVFKGSRKYNDKQIKRRIEGRGGSINAYTGHESTGYYAHGLKNNLISTLDILLDMVFFPSCKQIDVDKERMVIFEEIKMHMDIPQSRASMLIDQMLWEKHPLGEEIIGNYDTVAQINQKQLLEFQQKYYQPTNLIIVCVADKFPSRVIKEIKKTVADLKKRDFFERKREKPKKLAVDKLTVEGKDVEQAHLCIGFRSFPFNNRYRHALKLLNIILGANMSSRLFEEIREKRGFCYDISSELRFYCDSGAFFVHAGLAVGNLKKTLTCIFKELIKISTTPPSGSELKRAQDYYLGQFLMNIEQPQSRLFYLADQYIMLQEKIEPPLKVIEEIKRITSKDIQRTAAEIFYDKNFCISCVAPKNNEVEKILVEEKEKIRKFLNGS